MGNARLWALLLIALLSADACTIGVFSGRVASDGRPMIWKNRDVTNPEQAVRYFEGSKGGLKFIAIVYAGETTKAWAGINSAGFAIINSTSANLGAGASGGMDDGEVMKVALANCLTVQDFERQLQALSIVGLSVPSNFGVMDSSGTTAMFECRARSFVGYYSDAQAEGFVVRANFSLSGDTVGQKSYGRYARARQLINRAKARGGLDSRFLLDSVARDMGTVDFDPYPLPYQGQIDSLPYGFLPVTTTISRRITRSAVVITGRRAGAPEGLSTMWTILGEPTCGIAVPLWVGAGSVPDELRDIPTARLCDQAKRIREYIYSEPSLAGALNSVRVAEVLRAFEATNDLIAETTMTQLAGWAVAPPSATEFLALERLATRVADSSYESFWTIPPPPPDIGDTRDKSAGIRVGVNPTSGRVFFFLPETGAGARLDLYDALGRLHGRLLLAGAEKTVCWQSNNTPAGRYVAVLRSKDRTGTVMRARAAFTVVGGQ